MERSSTVKAIVAVATIYLLYSLTIYQDDSGSDQIRTMTDTTRYICDFEVFGKVQGVFFRKYTKEKAKSLGLAGWCENTPSGTVKGQLEGLDDKILAMQEWLQKTGSPHSKISHAEFSAHLRPVTSFTSETFQIRR